MLEYFDPKKEEGMTASIDMVRQTVRFKPKSLDDLLEVCDTAMTSEAPVHWESNKPAGWRHLYALEFDEGKTAAVGLVFNDPKGAPNEGRGFIEFNPNKLMGNPAFVNFYKRFVSRSDRIALDRFDLAVDIPDRRNLFQLVKDRRKYEFHSSGALTEYLGRKNRPGRVKLYDKAAESGLEYPLTRLEMTCDGSWTLDKVVEQLPTVLDLRKPSESFKDVPSIAMLISLGRLGECVESFIAMYQSKRTQAKIRSAIATSNSASIPTQIIADALASCWARYGSSKILPSPA